MAVANILLLPFLSSQHTVYSSQVRISPWTGLIHESTYPEGIRAGTASPFFYVCSEVDQGLCGSMSIGKIHGFLQPVELCRLSMLRNP